MKQLRFVLAAALCVAVLVPAPSHAQNDHLKCYKIKDPLKLVGTADLDTPQFGVDPGCKISKAKFFCVPGTKTNVNVTDKTTNLPIVPLPVTGPNAGDRVCYKVKCPDASIPDQVVTDQFGTRTVTKFKASYLCTPAVKGTEYCGDGVMNGSEACDAGDDLACPGACQPDCTCPSATPVPCATSTPIPTATPPIPCPTSTPPPRFVDNGDGTITDNQTGLIWEEKVAGSGCLHCVNDTYAWSSSGTAPDGTAFTSFLNTLNGGATGVGNCVSPNSSTITGGFNGYCDWRLPSIVELKSIQDPSAPGCGSGSPCINPIFGPAAASFSWSSTTPSAFPARAWGVDFNEPGAFGWQGDGKNNSHFVRAVRGGS